MVKRHEDVWRRTCTPPLNVERDTIYSFIPQPHFMTRCESLEPITSEAGRAPQPVGRDSEKMHCLTKPVIEPRSYGRPARSLAIKPTILLSRHTAKPITKHQQLVFATYILITILRTVSTN